MSICYQKSILEDCIVFLRNPHSKSKLSPGPFGAVDTEEKNPQSKVNTSLLESYSCDL